MPLQRQLLQTGFRFGVDEANDPHHVPLGVLTRAENVRWLKSNRIEKRFGCAPLTLAYTDGLGFGNTIHRLCGGSSLGVVATDETSRLVYAEYLPSQSSWKKLGTVSPYISAWGTVVDDVVGAGSWDSCVTSNGYEVLIFALGDADNRSNASADPVRYLVRDVATGRVTSGPGSLTGSRIVRAVANGTSVYLVTCGSSTARLSVWTLDLSTSVPALSAETVLQTDAADPGAMDACMVGSNLFIVYAKNAGANRLAFNLYNPSGWGTVTPQVLSSATFPTYNEVACATGGSDVVGVLYFGVSGVIGTMAVTTLNRSTLAAVLAPTTVETGGVSTLTTGAYHLGMSWVSTGRFLMTYTWTDTSSALNTTTRATSRTLESGVISTSIVYGTQSAAWSCKPVFYDGRWVAWLHTNTDNFAKTISDPYTSFLVEIPTVARTSIDFAPHRRLSAGETIISGYPGFRGLGKPYVSGSTLVAPLGFVSSQSANTASGSSGSVVLNYNYRRLGVRRFVTTRATGDYGRSATFGAMRLVMLGSFCSADGVVIQPYGFSMAPSVRFAGTTGGTVLAGTYLYAPTAEWRDANGILFRSPTSIPTRVVLAGASNVSLTYATLGADANQMDFVSSFAEPRPTRIVTHRTVAGGSSFFRLTMEPLTLSQSFSVTTSGAAFATDTSPDTDIGGGTALNTRPLLYTTGGILDDYGPPGFLTFTTHRRRIWGVDGTRRRIWFSKNIDDDAGTAPGFNPLLIQNVDEDVTALASLDDKLVIFSATGIDYLLGDGPGPSGQGSDLTAPNSVQTDVGCTNPRSVVSTPDGVMFQSASGISLLTRGLEVVWLGRPVQDVLAAFPNITSAVLVARRNEVRFTANDAAGTSHTVLVWNYVEKQWSTSRYFGGSGAIVDACLWGDTWVFATATGIFAESSADWRDNGAYVPMTLETAWVSASGPLAFQSVREFQLEGTSNSNHDLTVEVAFDSESSYTQSRTFLAGSAVTAIGPFEECTVAIGVRRKCNHVRFRITDATPTSPGSFPVGNGRGPSFDTMGIEVGIKQGFATNPATKRG